MKLPINVVGVGCGAAMELLYSDALRQLQGKGWIKIVGLADASDDRRAWASRAFPRCRVFSDPADVYRDIHVGLSILTSPPPLHAAHLDIAMRNGSHVLCEKPLADSVVNGQRMILAATKRDRMLGVGMTRRFYPSLAEARSWIRDSKLGDIRSYSYTEGGVYSWPVRSTAPFSRETAGGGVLLDKGVHVLDLLSWLFGPADLMSSSDDSLSGGVEGNSIVRLRHGAVEGKIQLSWDQDLNNAFTIRGSRGDLMIPIGPIDAIFSRLKGASWERVQTSATWPCDMDLNGRADSPRTYYDCIYLQLVQYLRAIVHGMAIPVSAESAMKTLMLIEEAYRSATWLEQDWLPENEQMEARKAHWRLGV